jgi:hypothetical protein
MGAIHCFSDGAAGKRNNNYFMFEKSHFRALRLRRNFEGFLIQNYHVFLEEQWLYSVGNEWQQWCEWL